MTPQLILVGPTGVGKTAVAIELCEILGGEIVSADSLQIYRGLDIGTAKASPEEQARAPHHLIDIRSASESYSAAQWADDARIAIIDIQSRGKTPVICGGTGFYLRALLNPETLAAVAPNEKLRARLQEESTRFGPQYLHQQLQERDPSAAARLHPNDTFRVIRALEVSQAKSDEQTEKVRPKSGCPPMAEPSEGRILFSPVVFALNLPREMLYARLDARTDAMIESGFMGELAALLHGAPQSPALNSIGYKQMLPALMNPAQWDECLALWKRDTRRYAKRQMTWFRHQIQACWIEMDSIEPRQAAEMIAQEWRGATCHAKQV